MSKVPATTPMQLGKTSAWQVYKRLLGYVKPYTGWFVLSFLGFLVFGLSNIAFVKILENLVNVIEANNPSDRYWVPLQVIGATLMRSVGGFIGIYLMSRIAFSIIHRLRVQTFNHMTRLPTSAFDANNSGSLISIITYNINGVTAAATDALKITLREGLTVLALFAYLIYMDWVLTLVFIVIAPLIGAIVGAVGKRLRRLSGRVQDTVGDLTQVTSEMINGFKVMRSFGGETYERDRFEAVSHQNWRQNMKIVATAAANTPLIQLIIAIAIAFLIYVALTFMTISEPAQFIAYMTAVAGILPAMRKLGEVAPTILKGVAAADSVFTLLDMAPEIDEGTHRPERVAGNITLQNVSFNYPNTESPALADISLDVSPGEVIALVGKSGSGKTTLVSLLNRFYDISEGKILIDGVRHTDFALDNLRAQIALVNQQVVLFDGTIAENIAYGSLRAKSEADIKAAAKAAYAHEFIDALPEGYNTRIGEGGARLSGGQRQRLAIARAILKDAPILIMDEATSALDNESERYIQAAMDTVMQGRTTFVVAHRLSTIEKADRILVMEKGRIIEQGNHKELLMKEGSYARLHASQFRA